LIKDTPEKEPLNTALLDILENIRARYNSTRNLNIKTIEIDRKFSSMPVSTDLQEQIDYLTSLKC
jgi:hypothetical protein